MTTQIENAAFVWLMNKNSSRTSENKKGKHLKYTKLKMAEYLCPSNIDISIDEKKWLFKCRVDDIDLKSNRRWQYEDISCSSCNSNSEDNQEHLLICKTLLGKSQILTYIPSYSELFCEDVEAQVYVARLLQDNYSRRIV